MFFFVLLLLPASAIALGRLWQIEVERNKVNPGSILDRLDALKSGERVIIFVCLGALASSFGYLASVEQGRVATLSQPLDAQTIEVGQEYQVVPAPDGVEWIKAKGSDEVTAYKFESSPPEQFIPSRTGGGNLVFTSVRSKPEPSPPNTE